MHDAVQRLRLSKAATSDPVLGFWREHGREWALGEASHEDLSRIAAAVERTEGKPEAAAAAEVVADFREVWRVGFADATDAYGWNEMNDGLPDAALLAFAKGAYDGWLEVRERI